MYKTPYMISTSDYYTLVGSGEDFDSDPVELTIKANAMSGSANIPVMCDKIVEGIETFDITLHLTNDNTKVAIGQSTSVVQIIDSTGMGGNYYDVMR